MAKLNLRVLEVLEKLKTLDSGRKLTIICNENKFQIYFKGKQISQELTLTDLRTISTQARRLNIVQLVDVSHLIFSGYVKSTDAYLKIEDDIARAFLHVINKMKFQQPSTNMATPGVEVAI